MARRCAGIGLGRVELDVIGRVPQWCRVFGISEIRMSLGDVREGKVNTELLQRYFYRV